MHTWRRQCRAACRRGRARRSFPGSLSRWPSRPDQCRPACEHCGLPKSGNAPCCGHRHHHRPLVRPTSRTLHLSRRRHASNAGPARSVTIGRQGDWHGFGFYFVRVFANGQARPTRAAPRRAGGTCACTCCCAEPLNAFRRTRPASFTRKSPFSDELTGLPNLRHQPPAASADACAGFCLRHGKNHFGHGAVLFRVDGVTHAVQAVVPTTPCGHSLQATRCWRASGQANITQCLCARARSGLGHAVPGLPEPIRAELPLAPQCSTRA